MLTRKGPIAALIMLIPLSLASAQAAYATIAALVTAVVTLEVLPTATKYQEYAFLGVSLVLLLRSRTLTQTLVSVVLVLVTIGLGLWGSELFAPSASGASATSRSSRSPSAFRQ